MLFPVSEQAFFSYTYGKDRMLWEHPLTFKRRKNTHNLHRDFIAFE